MCRCFIQKKTLSDFLLHSKMMPSTKPMSGRDLGSSPTHRSATRIAFIAIFTGKKLFSLLSTQHRTFFSASCSSPFSPPFRNISLAVCTIEVRT
ncbi:hypothetical protein LINPERPRIM_LOCUS21309 [Linum perenne]